MVDFLADKDGGTAHCFEVFFSSVLDIILTIIPTRQK